jgi:hypothetical protein
LYNIQNFGYLGVQDFMNAQPSFEPSTYSPQQQTAARSLQPQQPASTSQTGATPRQRIKANPAQAHRRQGVEAVMKVATYSALSVFGVVTLVNLISYNWLQQSKLQHLEIELKDAKLRTEKINHHFGRSFDPYAQKSVIEENSYKIAPDRRQIILVPNRNEAALKAISK